MEVLALLIPLSIVLVGVALACFNWAVDHDQFEDLDRQGMAPLESPEDPPQ